MAQKITREERDRERSEELWGCRKINPVYCKTCVFAHGEAPFADLPEKAHCEIYSSEGDCKPDEVYYDGQECEYYEKDT